MTTKPIVDLRIYTIRPRGMPEYLRLFEELALPAALRHWGEGGRSGSTPARSAR
jgi:hypothetical protein